MSNVLSKIERIAIVSFWCLSGLSLSSTALAASQSEYLAFFDNYQKLSQNFDVTVADLYAPNAQIHYGIIKPNGHVHVVNTTGKRFKNLLRQGMALSKQRGDINHFSNIKIKMMGRNRAQITADRYAERLCFTDNTYTMVIQDSAKHGMLIVKEEGQSPSNSHCGNGAANQQSPKALAPLLQEAATLLNKQLPAKVDRILRMDSATAAGKTLTLDYSVLKNNMSARLLSEFRNRARVKLIRQSCQDANFHSLLNRGATITYRYVDLSNNNVFTLNVDRDSCKRN